MRFLLMLMGTVWSYENRRNLGIGKRPVSTGGSASSSGGESAQGEGIIYDCGAEDNYISSITADVRVEINCNLTQFHDIEILAEGSDWCAYEIHDSPYLTTNCTMFCTVAGMECIDAWNTVRASDCDSTAAAMTCLEAPTDAHSCVCWDSQALYTSYWDNSKRDFAPMLIFVLILPFCFFIIAAFMWYKSEQLEDQLEKAKAKQENKKRASGTMSSAMNKRMSL